MASSGSFAAPQTPPGQYRDTWPDWMNLQNVLAFIETIALFG